MSITTNEVCKTANNIYEKYVRSFDLHFSVPVLSKKTDNSCTETF